MKILTFAATNSKHSINKQLAIYASQQIEGAEVEVVDLNDYELPLYSVDREQEYGEIPSLAQKLFAKIGAADAIIIAFAEHNGTYTAAYKNIFDWMSRINQKVFQNQPVVLLAASPGPGGAKSVLQTAVTSAPYFAADVRGQVSVANFHQVFDANTQQIIDAEIQQQIEQAVSNLLAVEAEA